MAKLNSGTRIYGNVTVDTFVTATGNVIAGNVTTVGLVSSTGNITGGNILTAGLISATSTITSAANVIGGNISTAGLVTATGNITGGNILSAGIISTSGNIFGGGIRSTSSGTAPSSPSVGDFWYNTTTNVQYRFTFDGTSYYWIDDYGSTVGVNGTFNAITNGTSNVSINVANGNITVGIGGTSNVVVLANTGQYVTGIVSASGNVTGGNITTVGLVTATGNISASNLLTGGQVYATGTVTGFNGVIVGPWNLGSTDISAAAIGGGAAASGRTLLGWNRSGGGGEFDIINNPDGGSSGGVSFYNWANTLANTTSLIFNVAGTTSNVTVYGNINNGQANGVGNIGNATTYFNTVFAKATSALYADLAETYISDNSYSPGTLVIFGGADEITASTVSHDTRVAGIISTAPAYLMNSGVVGLPVALTGRVPCSVVGEIRKGDRLVSSNIKGVATVLDSNKYLPGCIIGKSLEDYNSNSPGVIEVAVGRY